MPTDFRVPTDLKDRPLWIVQPPPPPKKIPFSFLSSSFSFFLLSFLSHPFLLSFCSISSPFFSFFLSFHLIFHLLLFSIFFFFFFFVVVLSEAPIDSIVGPIAYQGRTQGGGRRGPCPPPPSTQTDTGRPKLKP